MDISLQCCRRFSSGFRGFFCITVITSGEFKDMFRVAHPLSYLLALMPFGLDACFCRDELNSYKLVAT